MTELQQLSLRERALHRALLIALPLLVFWNSLHGSFHLDDVYRIANNTALEPFWPPWRHFVDPHTSATLPNLVQYRPLLPLSLSGNIAVGELLGLERLLSLHLGNVIIHVAGVLLLYGLLRELLEHWGTRKRGSQESARLALVAALLYGVHPVSGVSVNYMCGRDVLLMLAFLLAALLVHVRWRRLGGGAWRVPLFCALLLASLLSKTNALIAPFLILLFEFTCGQQRLGSRSAWLRSIPAVVTCASLQAFVSLGLGFSDAAQVLIRRESVLEYPLTQLRVHLAYYARNLVWPFYMRAEVHMDPVHSALDPWVFGGFALVSTSLWLVWRWRHLRPLWAFGLGAYWLLFAMTSSVLPMRRLVTDYRQVGSLAFGVLFVTLLGHYVLRGRARIFVAVVVLTWFAGSSVHMNRHWRTEQSFWLQSVTHGGSALAHMNYGLSVVNEDPELAEVHYLRTLEMYPQHVYGHINLGLLRLELGAVEEGLRLVQRAVEIEPDWAISRHWYSVALGKTKRWNEAVAAAVRATELDPRNELYRQQLRRALYAAGYQAQASGAYEEALAFVRRLHTSGGELADSIFIEAFLLQVTGEVRASLPLYVGFLEANPGHYQAHFNLGCARMELDEPRAAIESFEAALLLDPPGGEAHRKLATCYAGLGESTKSAEHAEAYRRSLDREP